MNPDFFFPPPHILLCHLLWQLDRSTREVELGLEYGPPVLNIEGQTWKFEGGHWNTGTD